MKLLLEHIRAPYDDAASRGRRLRKLALVSTVCLATAMTSIGQVVSVSPVTLDSNKILHQYTAGSTVGTANDFLVGDDTKGVLAPDFTITPGTFTSLQYTIQAPPGMQINVSPTPGASVQLINTLTFQSAPTSAGTIPQPGVSISFQNFDDGTLTPTPPGTISNFSAITTDGLQIKLGTVQTANIFTPISFTAITYTYTFNSVNLGGTYSRVGSPTTYFFAQQLLNGPPPDPGQYVTLQAIPEPRAYYACFGLGALAVALRIRRNASLNPSVLR